MGRKQPVKNIHVRLGPVTVIVALTTAVISGVAGCGSVVKTSTPAHTAHAAARSSKATPSPAPSLSGPVGTSYSVTDPNGNKISVTLTREIDPAQGADQFTTPETGTRFVAHVFDIKGISGPVSDDA